MIKAVQTFDEKVKEFGSLLMVVQTGSHAYGLNTPDSDEDFRGIFIPNQHYLLGLGIVEQVKIDGDDWVCHDLRQFVKLVIKQNPTILEILFIEPVFFGPFWMEVCGQLRKLITKNAFKPYSAYVRSQIAKALNRQPIGKRARIVEEIGYDTKFVSHCARLAVQCIGLMNTGIIPVKLPEPYRSEILAIKLGKRTKDEALKYCTDLDKQMYEACHKSQLPESVDINQFEKDYYIPWMQAITSFNNE